MSYSMDQKCKYVTDKSFIDSYVQKVTSLQEKLDTTFEEYIEQAKKDTSYITKEIVMEELNANIGKFQRWLERLYSSKKLLNDLEAKLQKMETQIFHYYKFCSDFSTSLKYDSAVTRYVDANECRLALYELIKNYKALIEFIENTAKNLNNRNYTIKNIIDVWTHELGLN